MNPLHRTLLSFAVLIFFLVGVAAVVFHIRDVEDDLPPLLRAGLEFQGKLWHSLFSPHHLSQTRHRPSGAPRVNGDIGLEGPIDSSWRLEVFANIDDPAAKHFVLTLKDLQSLPKTESNTEFRCIEGWSEPLNYAGIRFSDFMNAYGLEKHPYVGLISSDGEYYVSIDLESMLHPQTLLALSLNGSPLERSNGAPLRLIIPVKYGIKHLKHIGKIFFSDHRPPDYWAERGYDWFAGL